MENGPQKRNLQNPGLIILLLVSITLIPNSSSQSLIDGEENYSFELHVDRIYVIWLFDRVLHEDTTISLEFHTENGTEIDVYLLNINNYTKAYITNESFEYIGFGSQLNSSNGRIKFDTNSLSGLGGGYRFVFDNTHRGEADEQKDDRVIAHVRIYYESEPDYRILYYFLLVVIIILAILVVYFVKILPTRYSIIYKRS